ncbi:PREDICTED: BTB/POZ domain-containing protein KCTD7-like [Branchiostoma belcheri]|uniref:BTB/POZ domain-containing protein KCTD7-like n=1 Tax=Branchiostoma belcheri TaxID=7741 RepID=A0A6P4YBC5_BRABE|nr:PREDICTED: BTB/POZ domain-containing protein KCTD7-like [Branchiostoma belcheri]
MSENVPDVDNHDVPAVPDPDARGAAENSQSGVNNMTDVPLDNGAIRPPRYEYLDEECHDKFPEVINLNVGGVHFTTLLSTLRSQKDSMLAGMFSGRHKIQRDEDGRYFIDRDGALFTYILAWLRTEQMPPRAAARRLYSEAQHYGLLTLMATLQNVQPVASDVVKTQFVSKVPNYKELLEQIIIVGRERAKLDMRRQSRVLVTFHYLNDGPQVKVHMICELARHDVGFLDLPQTLDVATLLSSIEFDLVKERGFNLTTTLIDTCKGIGYICGFKYDFTFTWW